MKKTSSDTQSPPVSTPTRRTSAKKEPKQSSKPKAASVRVKKPKNTSLSETAIQDTELSSSYKIPPVQCQTQKEGKMEASALLGLGVTITTLIGLLYLLYRLI